MGKFSDYAGLFAQGGDFDVPSSIRAGLVYSFSPDFKMMFYVKRIFYSSIYSVGNPIDPMALPPAFLNPGGNPANPMDYTPNPHYTPLGSENGSGFGWEDMTIFKFGMEYEASESWTLKSGFSHGDNPVGASEVLFNILAPGIIENHIALGDGKKLANGNRLDFSFDYALNSSVSGPNPFDFDPVQAANGVLVLTKP